MKELKETIELMSSPDYKERFKAEYWQTKIRYEKLRKFCTKIEARDKIRCSASMEPNYVPPVLENLKYDCPYDVLSHQRMVMDEYLHILEVRAEIEDIDLLD